MIYIVLFSGYTICIGGRFMAKNSSRSNNNSKKKAAPSAAQAKELKAKRDKAAEAAGKEREVLYQVKTKRDSDILKAFITFTYRVNHPGVTIRLIFFGILIAAPSIIAKQMWLKIALLAAGLLLILLGLFRQYISLALTKKNDPDYQAGTEFIYEFTANDASFYRDGELTSYASKYKDIISFYYDEDYFYLGIRNRDFFILPKSRFTIGDPAAFEDFIYQKSRKTCHWIPNNFKDQMAQRRAYRAMNSEKK